MLLGIISVVHVVGPCLAVTASCCGPYIERKKDTSCCISCLPNTPRNSYRHSVRPTTSTSTALYLSVKITRVGRDRDRALMLRGWSRLCLHAASLSAPRGASAISTTAARAARTEAMEMEASAAAENAVPREKVHGEATEFARREKAMGQVDWQQQERRAKMLVRRCGACHSLYCSYGFSARYVAILAIEIHQNHTLRSTPLPPSAHRHSLFPFVPQPTAALNFAVKIARVGRDGDRALMFRGWSRLCLHAASLSAAEGASASATAAARVARAEAMKTEATAAAEKAKAWKKAAAASADVAASKEQALREAAELVRGREVMNQVDRQQRECRAKMLVRCSDRSAPS